MARPLTAAEVRRGFVGRSVERAAAVLPATTTSAIFTITGTVRIMGIVGVCTTVCSATATNLSVVHVPSSPGTVNLTLASALAIANFAAGTYVGVEGDGTTLVGVTGVAGFLGSTQYPDLGPGSISLTTSATNTGQFRWILLYIPLSDDALVVAA